MQFPLLSIVIIASILMASVFILYILKYKPAKNYRILVILTSGCLIYLTSLLFEYISIRFVPKVIWNHGTSIGMVIILLSFFIFSVGYVGKEQWLTTKKFIIISAIPVIYLLFDITNELHGLSLTYGLVTIDSLTYLTKEYHAISWVFVIYGYMLVIASFVLLIRMALSALNYYRKRVIFILLLSFIPIIVNLLHTSGIFMDYFDPTPVSVTFSAILFLFGVTKYNIGDMVPTTNKVLIESIRDGVIVLDSQDRIVEINPIARRLIRYPRVIGEDIKVFWPHYTKFLQEKDDHEKELEIGSGQERQIYDVEISECRNYKSEIMSRIISLRNITDRKITEERLKYLSFHDKMTRLYNRAFFEEEMTRLDSSRRLPVSIIMGDADGLKFINDTFGYSEGDKLLVSIADALSRSCRKDDIIARWGGDEFAILLIDTDEGSALKVVSRIEEACNETIDNSIPISISLGAAAKTDGSRSLKDIMRLAEDRMRRRKMLKTASVHSAMIKSLKNTLHEKSHETKEHLDRLENLSREFGARIGLTSSQIDDLSLVAVLHDIGKITIADKILSKKSGLTAGEWDKMKKHSEIGFRIASAAPQIAPIAESILHHHEWWDGSGYPAGLKERKIPLLSRIISIIDAYDVMLNGRPYKEAMAENEVIEELIRCAGTQFDPRLVRDFINIIKGKKGFRISASPSS